MSQVTNNHEGGFDFPSKLTSDGDPQIAQTPSSARAKEVQHSEVISQAQRDRNKAEELIASFDKDSECETSFISFADDDENLRPGDFAAADPYVNTRENNNTDDTINEDKKKVMEKNTAAAGLVGIVGGVGSTKTPQDKPGGITNLSIPQESGAEKGVRTVDQILSSIPGYEEESETVTEPISKPKVEVASSTAPATAAAETATGKPVASEKTADAACKPCSVPVDSSGEAVVPVSWFNQTETKGDTAEGAGSAETCKPADSVGVNFISTSVDPASGEEQFNVADFSEMAGEKIKPIPNAFLESSETADPTGPTSNTQTGSSSARAGSSSESSEEKIHSPLSRDSVGGGASAQPATADNTASRKTLPVTTVVPVKSALSSATATAATAGAGVAAAGAGLLASALGKSDSGSAAAADSSADQAASSQATSTTPAAVAEPARQANGNPLSKKAPPAPKIDDSEIAAALAKCEDKPEPIESCKVADFSTETFGESKVTSSEVEVTETQSDNTFLADEGDVIRIDGNDGYEFIDLACFERSAAKVERDRIIVKDEINPAFEVHYKNVQYVLFAGDVRVDLPPRDLPPRGG